MTSIRPFRKLPKLSALSLPALLLCLTGCAGERLTALPPQLVGEWRTTEGRYQGRFMRLEADRITFGMGGAGPDKLERIQNVRFCNVDAEQEYRINLLTADGSTDTLTLDFTQGNGGELHLKNQPKIVWRIGKASPHAAPATPAHASELPQTPVLPAVTGNRHNTIYRIDCLRPNVCKSY